MNRLTYKVIKKSLQRIGENKVIVVALSGGVDSMCLTHMLTQYRDNCNQNLQIHAVTIDHKYRKGSYEEAEQIGELVSKWGVKHSIEALSYDGPVLEIANFEEVARLKRYTKFQEVCRSLQSHSLFVGHNLDDQLETYLYRLSHKSTLFGLIGLHERSAFPDLPKNGGNQNDGRPTIVRPLLDVTKSDIITYCTTRNITWFEDATNKDPHLTERNTIRHILNDVVPFNKTNSILSKDSLTETCQEIKQIVDIIEQKADILYKGSNDIDERNGSVSIEFPIAYLKGDNQLILSRFLYRLLLRISSVKYYHWVYAKIERGLVPSIAKMENTKNGRFKLTYLNLVFDGYFKDGMIHVDISRQPMMKEAIEENTIQIVNDAWVYFDRRFYVRVKAKNGNCVLLPYIHGKHVLHSNLENSDLNRSMNGAPAVMVDGVIVLLPSYGISGVELECYLKSSRH